MDALRDTGTGDVVLHPIVIYQAFLDQLDRINMAQDADAWFQTTEFPYSVHTDKIDIVIESPAQGKPFFDTVCDLIRDHKIDEFRRVAEHAEYLDRSMIVGHHTTHLRSGGVNVVKPMSSRMVVRNTTGVWRMISVTNAIANDEYPYKTPEVSDGLLPAGNIRRRALDTTSAGGPDHLDIALGERDPLVIYHAFVRAFTKANTDGDFETWNAMHMERTRKHSPESEMTIDSRFERRAIFKVIADEMRQSGATKHERIPYFAEWMGDDHIRGKHRSVMTRDGKVVRTPIESQFVLQRDGRRWRVMDVSNSVDIDAPLDVIELLEEMVKPDRDKG